MIMAKKRKDEPSNKDRLVRFLQQNEAKNWSLNDMAQWLWNDETPGLIKMASGVFTGARRVLQDDYSQLVIPIKWEGRRAVEWKFADANSLGDRVFVLSTMVRKEHAAIGWGNSLLKALAVAEKNQLISSEDAGQLRLAYQNGDKAERPEHKSATEPQEELRI